TLDGVLRCRDVEEQPVHGVECAVCVVSRECFLVRPTIPHVAQLANVGSIRLAELCAKDFVPGVPHRLEQELGIVLRNLHARFVINQGLDPSLTVLRYALAFHKGGETLAEKGKRTADSFVVSGGHRFSLRGSSGLSDRTVPQQPGEWQARPQRAHCRTELLWPTACARRCCTSGRTAPEPFRLDLRDARPNRRQRSRHPSRALASDAALFRRRL